MIKSLIWIGIGGGIGSMLRFSIGQLSEKIGLLPTLPMGTFLVNLTGCFIAGILSAYFSKNGTEDTILRQLMITGFCGGFTTFSAFGVESIRLMESGRMIEFFSYTVLSIVIGFGACYLGMFLGRY